MRIAKSKHNTTIKHSSSVRSRQPRGSQRSSVSRSSSGPSKTKRTQLAVDDIIKDKINTSFRLSGAQPVTSLEEAITETRSGFRKSVLPIQNKVTDTELGNRDMIRISSLVCIPEGFDKETRTLNKYSVPSKAEIVNLEASGLAISGTDEHPLCISKSWGPPQSRDWMERSLPDLFRYAKSKKLELILLGRKRSTLVFVDVPSFNGKMLYDLKGPSKCRTEEAKLFITFSEAVPLHYRDDAESDDNHSDIIESDAGSEFTGLHFGTSSIADPEAESISQAESDCDTSDHSQDLDLHRSRLGRRKSKTFVPHRPMTRSVAKAGREQSIKQNSFGKKRSRSGSPASGLRSTKRKSRVVYSPEGEEQSPSVPCQNTSATGNVTVQNDMESTVIAAVDAAITSTHEVIDLSNDNFDDTPSAFDELYTESNFEASSSSYIRQGDTYYPNIWGKSYTEDKFDF